jgi:hypothetical protein
MGITIGMAVAALGAAFMGVPAGSLGAATEGFAATGFAATGEHAATERNGFDAATDGHGRVYVTEGNSLVRVAPRGRKATVAVFGNRGVPGLVPSGVALGPDGAFYVGESTTFAFRPGQARVWRVVPGEEPQVYAVGLTAVVSVAWSAEGRLRVRERNGEVVQLGPHSRRIRSAG